MWRVLVLAVLAFGIGTAAKADICTDFFWNGYQYLPHDYICYDRPFHYRYYHHDFDRYRPYHEYRHFEGHQHYGARSHEYGGHHR